MARPAEGAREFLRGDAAASRAAEVLSQKIQKSSKSLLTPGGPPAYIRLNNEGGAPLAQTSSPLCYEIKRAA
jgi:hypothetical protein